MRWSLYFGPSRALFSAPGPLETLLSRKHDSINLLTPPSDADRHLRWRQANSEDIGTVHISVETLNQPEEIQAVCFSRRDHVQTDTPCFYTSVPFLIPLKKVKLTVMKWTWRNRCGAALLIVGIYTSGGQSWMLDASLSCDVCCILGIDGPVTV